MEHPIATFGWKMRYPVLLLAAGLLALAMENDARGREGPAPSPLKAGDGGGGRAGFAADPGPVPEGSLARFARVWEKIDFFGDLRFRYQLDFNRNKVFDPAGRPSEDDRHQGRMRLRFGARYPFHETLRFETRFRTRNEENDPRDDDLSFGRQWRTGDVGMDLLNLTLRPILDEQDLFWVRVGKFRNVLRQNPVMGGLVWDPDLNPEGVAAGSIVPLGMGPLDRLHIAAGGYVSVEQNRANDVAAFAAQAALDTAFAENVRSTLAVSYTGFNDTSPAGQALLADLDEGNYLVNGDYRSDFHIWDSYGALFVEAAGIPVTVSGEWIANPGAEINRDHGWTAGVAAGTIEEPGDFRVYYQYQEIEQDALFTPIARSDFARLTNYRGSAAGASWCFFTNMELAATVSWVRGIERGGGAFTQPRHESRFRLDLIIRF